MKLTIFYILINLVLISCANIQSPPGGSGDTTAPELIFTEPESMSKNFSGKKIVLGFDDYMNRGKVIQSITYSPNIQMVSYDWNTSNLTITIDEKLRENTTYVISLGTDFTDFYNNAPKKSQSLIFSTGNEIDTGRIAGKVYAKEVKGKYIFAYIEDNGFPDPSENEADYIVQLGTSGEFEILALKPGKYRLFAIDDVFLNKKYDPSTDAIGTPLKDFIIDSINYNIENVSISLGPKPDDIAPEINSVFPINNKLIEIKLSENIDISQKNSIKIGINDTLDNPIDYEFWGFKADNLSSAYLVFKDGFKNKIKLNLEINNLIDSAGNINESSATQFISDTIVDNNILKIDKTNLRDSVFTVVPEMHLEDSPSLYYIRFNHIPEKSSINPIAKYYNAEDTIKASVKSRYLNEYIILAEKPLKENVEYKLEIDLKNAKAIDGNIKMDSTIKILFKTSFLQKKSIIRGFLEDSKECNGPYIVRLRSKDEKNTYIKTLDTPGSWVFNDVRPGLYFLEAFCDEDKNGNYSFGSIIPFIFRERYIKSEQELKVEENWEYDNIKLIIKE